MMYLFTLIYDVLVYSQIIHSTNLSPKHYIVRSVPRHGLSAVSFAQDYSTAMVGNASLAWIRSMTA